MPETRYRVLQDIPDRQWKAGDVVAVRGKVQSDLLEEVAPDTPYNHVVIVVDPLRMGVLVNPQ